MSLIKRGSVWHVCLTSPSGKRIRQTTGTKDREQAQEYHDTLKAQLWRTHRLGDKQRRTWQEAIVRWSREKEYKADLKKDLGKLSWLDQFLGHCYLDEINRDLIDAIADKKKSEASPATVNRYLALIRSILRMAKDDWEWIDHIPRIRLFPEPKKRVRFLTQDEARNLIQELPTHLALMARFSLATGLRQRNVSFLTWDQVDVQRQVAWIYADQTKSRKAITVPLNQDALQVLDECKGVNNKYVFTYKDKPVERTSTAAFKKACMRAEIENFRWHDLRHTWASWHVQNGTTLQELMELGGWSCMEMVLRYAHFAGEHLQIEWWPRAELNHRHEDFQSTALPTELLGHIILTTDNPLLSRSENKIFNPLSYLAATQPRYFNHNFKTSCRL